MGGLLELWRRIWVKVDPKLYGSPMGEELAPPVSEAPGRYDPEIKFLSIENEAGTEKIEIEAGTELTGGDLDPNSLIHGVEPSIGDRNRPGTTYYSSVLVVPAWLERESTAGFEWGRHVLLVGKIIPELTYRKLLDFLDDYCRASAGRGDEAAFKLAQLGHWEFEDIGSGAPDRPKWHIQARLISLFSPDVDLETFRTSPDEDFGIRVHAEIGAAGGIEAGAGTATFEFLLCTPGWLAARRDLSEIMLCSNIAFMRPFDLRRVRQEVESVCTELKGYSGEEAIGKMRRYATPITQ